jgi:glycosyltransferase involved in cell wall biosynthesis
VCPSYLTLRDGKVCTECVDGGYYRCAAHQCHKNNLAASLTYAAEAYYARLNDSYGAISAFLCPSRFMADLLRQSGIDPKRIVYHPNCVEPDLYEPCYEGRYALYTGRLSHEKGIATLVEALKGTGIPLRIAGGGPMEHALRMQAAGEDGSGIAFEGHCEGERLAALYRNAAFVVVPSEWNENAPMAILEAFAYGKPVVGARIGGIPEMIEDGENGYLFQSGSGDELQVAAVRLWNDRQGQRRMGHNARQLIETRYSQARHTASLLGIYESLCKSRQVTVESAKSLPGILC